MNKEAHDSAKRKAHDLAAKSKKQNKQIAQLLSQTIIQAQALQEQKAEKERWFKEEPAALSKSAQELTKMQTTSTRPEGGLKAKQALFDAIDSLGNATEE
jgi:hypothetical protein